MFHILHVTYDIRGAFALKNYMTLTKYKKTMEEKIAKFEQRLLSK